MCRCRQLWSRSPSLHLCRPGMTAVIEVAELTVKLVAAVLPNFTAVAPVKLVPVMVTLVPPVAGPEVGARPLTVGAAT